MSKIVKYIICAILTVGAFSFISEVYAWYLYDFETQYTYVTFYAPAGADSRQMKEDLSAAAKDNDVSIFVVERKIESSFHVDVNIYAMPEAAEKLMSNQIRDGNYKSLFLGDYSIRLREFSELSDPTKYTEFQLVGESENITDLKKTLVDEYGGAFPREGYASFNSGSAVMLVWGIVFAFLLLMTMYETAVKKKETVVRLISGQSIGHYAMKNILTDLAAYTALFLSVGILSCIMVNGDYCLGRTLFMMVLFLILNSLVYLWLLSVNYKKDIAGRSGLKGVLKVSYIYKTAFMLIVVLLLSGSVSLIYEGAEHRMQRDFFERYGDYYYPMISSRPDADEATSEEVGRIGDEFHLTHLKQGKALTMQYIGYEEGNDNYIFSNGAALSYITDKIPELKDMEFEEKVYIIQPERYQRSGNREKSAEDFADWYVSDEARKDSLKETITYRGDADVVALTRQDRVTGQLLHNPVIIFDNTGGILEGNLSWYDSLIQVSDEEWEVFIEDNDLEDDIVYRTNVYENYQRQWELLRQGMIIGITMFLLLAVLEVIITNRVLRYEFKVNAVELVLRKLSGGSFFSRYEKLFDVTVFSSIAGIVLSLPAGLVLGFELYGYIVASAVVVMILELAVSSVCILHMEKASISKILKGGLL